MDRRLVVPEGLPLPPEPETVLTVPGFRWLRRQTFSTPAVEPRTVEIYLCELFHSRLVAGGLIARNQTHPACEFVLVPGGEFMMGSPQNEPGRQQNEGPQRLVTVLPFLLARTPAVRAVADQPLRSAEPYLLPQTNVSWDMATDWLDMTGMRLPSEAEWEYACRAGSPHRWCFGNDEGLLEEWAVYNQEWTEGPWLVGLRNPNAFGLLDMHGNVWEWCQDTYANSYRGAPDDGQAVEKPGAAYRVVRGGGWVNEAANCRSAYRFGFEPGWRYANLGFRPAKSIDDATFAGPSPKPARAFAVAGPDRNEPAPAFDYATLKTTIARGQRTVLSSVPEGCEPSPVKAPAYDIRLVANLMPAPLLARGWFRVWSCLYPGIVRQIGMMTNEAPPAWLDATRRWGVQAIDALRAVASTRNWRAVVAAVLERERQFIHPTIPRFPLSARAADVPRIASLIRRGLSDALQSLVQSPGNRSQSITDGLWRANEARRLTIDRRDSRLGQDESNLVARLMLGAWPIARITELLRGRGRVQDTYRDLPAWVVQEKDPPRDRYGWF